MGSISKLEEERGLHSDRVIPPVSSSPPRGAHGAGTRLVLNTLSNFIGQAIVILLTFFSTPYITRKLGPEQYGALTLLVTYLFSFSLLNLGMNSSLIKHIAESLARHELDSVQKYVSTGLVVLVGLGALVGAVIFVLADPIVSHFFNNTAELNHSIILALRVASIAFVMQFYSQVVLSVPIAAQRFEVVNIVRTSAEAARVIGTVAVVYLGGRLPWMIAVILIVSFLTCVAYSIVAKMLIPSLSLAPSMSRPHALTLLKHSRFILVNNTSDQVVSSTDNVIIGYFLPVSALAYYGVAYTLGQRLSALVGNVSSVVFPAASAYSGTNRRESLPELYLRGVKIAIAVACFPAFALALFSHTFLLFWLGSDYATHGAVVLSLLSIGFLLNSLTFVPYNMLQSTHYASTAAKGAVAYALLNISLFVGLIPKYGIVGASIGFLIAQVLYIPWLVWTTNKILGVGFLKLVRLSYLRVVAIAAAVSVLCEFCRPLIDSLFKLGVLVAIGLIIYGVLGFWLILDPRERRSTKELFSRYFPSAQKQPANAVIS